MEKINAVITGVGGYVPEYVLNNDELSRMVDTNDEWIMTRIGIKERRILNEEGLGTSYMARKAVKQLLEKTGTDPQEVDCVIVATTTPDYHFPSTSSIVIGRLGMKNAFAIDMQAACCGFLFAMDAASGMIQSGRYKKIVVCGQLLTILTVLLAQSLAMVQLPYWLNLQLKKAWDGKIATYVLMVKVYPSSA